MSRKMFAVLVFICVAAGVFGQEEPSILRYSELGFSITPLEVVDDTPQLMVLHSFLPADHGFAPNINVMIQQYDGTLADYKVFSEKQLAQQGWTVLKSKMVTESDLWIEYTGAVDDKEFHWLVRVVQGNGKVYLITATSLKNQYRKYAVQLETSLKSFALVPQTKED